MWWEYVIYLCMLFATDCMGKSNQVQVVTTQVLVNISAMPMAAAHCWNNAHCNGTIKQSFRNSSDCCVDGFSYIVCDQKTLKKILIEEKKTGPKKSKRQALCVVCPPKKVVKPKVCLPTTCPKRNEICVNVKGTYPKHGNYTFCISCDNKTVICGSNKRTYPNQCEMLRHGQANVVIHYYGPCKAKAKCADVKCQPKYKCVSTSGSAKCVAKNQVYCGSNNLTYASSYDMMRAATCQPLYAKRKGACYPNAKQHVVTKKCIGSNRSLWSN